MTWRLPEGATFKGLRGRRTPRRPDRQAAINLLPATPSFSAPASAMGSAIGLTYLDGEINNQGLQSKD